MQSFKISLLLSTLITFTFAQDTPKGEPIVFGHSHTIQSDILKQTRTINIYLPPGYQKSQKSYPVLYLLDGGVKEDFPHIVGIATLAADWRKIREFILVGIAGGDRYFELTQPSTHPDDLKRISKNGGATSYRKFIAKEVQPFITKNFRVTDETALIGESLAGLFVLDVFLNQPTLFTTYISISPSLWWNNQALAKAAPNLLANDFPKKRRLFLTIANEGGAMQEGVDKIVAALKQAPNGHINWIYQPMPGETHATIYHPAALTAVRTFFATPPEKKE